MFKKCHEMFCTTDKNWKNSAINMSYCMIISKKICEIRLLIALFSDFNIVIVNIFFSKFLCNYTSSVWGNFSNSWCFRSTVGNLGSSGIWLWRRLDFFNFKPNADAPSGSGWDSFRLLTGIVSGMVCRMIYS